MTGAVKFIAMGSGATASEAFSSLVRKAREEHGDKQRTGTIAEKNTFMPIALGDPPAGVSIMQHAQNEALRLSETESSPVHPTDGPAGCFETKRGEFMFFGWAIS